MRAILKLAAASLVCVLSASLTGPALADKIKHPVAVFSGLDKITGRIKSFEVAIDETAQFGTLQITPRVCFSRPTTEAPRTDVFAEVDEVEPDKTIKRIFSGWMFADSPGLHGIEHPVYDIWLQDCVGDGPLIHEAPEVAEAPDPTDAEPTAAPDPTKIQPTPKKPRKPRPIATEPAPLDLGAPIAQPRQYSGRGSLGGDAPIPPGFIGR